MVRHNEATHNSGEYGKATEARAVMPPTPKKCAPAPVDTSVPQLCVCHAGQAEAAVPLGEVALQVAEECSHAWQGQGDSTQDSDKTGPAPTGGAAQGWCKPHQDRAQLGKVGDRESNMVAEGVHHTPLDSFEFCLHCFAAEEF